MSNIVNEQEYKNINKESLVFKTNREEHFHVKNTLSRLQFAIENAQSIDYPNRWELYEIYFDILNDAHLKSLLKHRKTRITGLKYSILNKSTGNIDKNTTTLFKEFWFEQFLQYALDSFFWGNSLIEIMPKDGTLETVLIPRENVIPEFEMIKSSPYQLQGDIDYSQPIYSNNLVDINNENDKRNLGELLAVSKLILFKSEVLLNWSQYVEIFGQPIRVATTDSQDPSEINSILIFLKELGRSGYLVKNSQTTLDFVDSGSQSSSSSLYLDFIKLINDEISKQILGGTMITDSGSSRSQSEVHERASYLYTKSDILTIERIVNNKLLPVLKNLGYINAKNIEFKFEEPEILTTQEKLEVDAFLMSNFKVKDISYFEKRYGTGLEFIDNNDNENVEMLKQTMSFAKKTKDRYDINLKLTDE